MKYYRMKIDKQGKTQKKQSKKNYRKTLKGGLMEFLRGKSNRGKVENTIHQLDKIIKHTAKDTKKANTHTDRFNDAFKSIDAKVKGYIMNIVNETEDLQNVQGSHIIEGEDFATIELLEIIHGEMTEQRKKNSTFDSDKNHMFEYFEDKEKFDENNRELITATIKNQHVRDVIVKARSVQSAQGGKKTQKKRKRKRNKRKTASKK